MAKVKTTFNGQEAEFEGTPEECATFLKKVHTFEFDMGKFKEEFPQIDLNKFYQGRCLYGCNFPDNYVGYRTCTVCGWGESLWTTTTILGSDETPYKTETIQQDILKDETKVLPKELLYPLYCNGREVCAHCAKFGTCDCY